MNATLVMPNKADSPEVDAKVKKTINSIIDEQIASLPDPSTLTSAERHGIIARYTGVLEGNFIYWMTATLLAVKSEEAHPILLDNLHEEVRDAHPVMLRKFAVAAHAYPTDTDMLAVDGEVTKMRRFLGRLSGVQSLAAMAFFEGFIQKFMGYLASLAAAEGSTEMEYTDVHGVCDIEHTDGLFRALAIESANHPLDADKDVLEGVVVLRDTMQATIFGNKAVATA